MVNQAATTKDVHVHNECCKDCVCLCTESEYFYE